MGATLPMAFFAEPISISVNARQATLDRQVASVLRAPLENIHKTLDSLRASLVVLALVVTVILLLVSLCVDVPSLRPPVGSVSTAAPVNIKTMKARALARTARPALIAQSAE